MRLQTRLPAEFDPFFSAAAASSKPLTLERIMGSDQGEPGASSARHRWSIDCGSTVDRRIFVRD